jgi:cytochrome c-type biogenesis protein CcmH
VLGFFALGNVGGDDGGAAAGAAEVTYLDIELGALKLVPKDSEDAKMFESGIQQAREFSMQPMGGKPPVQAQLPSPEDKKPAVASGKEMITGTVTLSDAMKGKAGPEDTLFVLARATEGPKMPLAIVRKQVKDLPLKFTLDDSTAMTPQSKLSNFDKVVVIARISRSGNAITQPGDLQGMSEVIRPGTTGIKVSVDKIVQ